MLVRHKLAALAVATTTLALGVTAPAHAAEPENPQQSTLSHPVLDCGLSAQFWRRGTGTLSNGTLEIVGCERDSHITRVNLSYTKVAGADSTLRFGWGLLDFDGEPMDITWGKVFTQSANTTVSRTFTTDIPIDAPDHPCLQGVMRDQNSGRVFHTEIICP